MENDRILAKTLIGLRNIAWAAASQDKASAHAKFLYTMLQLAVENTGAVDIMRMALRLSKHNVPLP